MMRDEAASEGFTLLELLVVLFLLLLLYSIALFTFKYRSVEKKIAHENLRELLAPYLNSESPVELLCYDDCQHCIIIRDDEKLAHVENIFFSPSLEIYRPDIYGELKKIELPDRFIDGKREKVCLSYTLYPNQSATAMIVKDANQVYLYRPLSPEVEKFSTVDEAMASWSPPALLPTKDDLYYSRD